MRSTTEDKFNELRIYIDLTTEQGEGLRRVGYQHYEMPGDLCRFIGRIAKSRALGEYQGFVIEDDEFTHYIGYRLRVAVLFKDT